VTILRAKSLKPVLALASRATALIAVSAALGFGVNAARPEGLAIATFAPPTACTNMGEDPREGTHAAGADEPGGLQEERSITPRKASSLCSRADVVVLDTRAEGRYAEGHVAGAIHLPCDAAGARVHSTLASFEKASLAIVYGEHDNDAEQVAASLRQRLPRTTRVLVLEGGFAAWETANLSCVSGPCDECVGVSTSRPEAMPPKAEKMR
jgi:rhodanese-related sulfurtransferase